MSLRIKAHTMERAWPFNDEIKRNPSWLLENIVRFVRLSRRSQKNHASMTLRTKFDWIFGR